MTLMRPSRPGRASPVTEPITITALPQPINIETYRGDDFRLKLTVVDSITGSPMDLTGATPLSQFKIDTEDDAPFVQLDATIGGTAHNEVDLHLTSAASETLLPGMMVWDCQVTQTDGDVTTLCAGTVLVAPDVSRLYAQSPPARTRRSGS